MRKRSLLEIDIAKEVVCAGSGCEFEFAAFVDINTGECLSFKTDRNDYGCQPITEVKLAASHGAKIALHHNHLSRESLSWPDWNGAANIPFCDVFAYCDDGTIYWGRMRKKDDFNKYSPSRGGWDVPAEDAFLQFAGANNVEWAARFKKHAINLALKEKDVVEYEVIFGTKLKACAQNFSAAIDAAKAQVLRLM